MDTPIKLSLKDLSQEQRTLEMAKWFDHPAYALFIKESGQERDHIAHCALGFSNSADIEAFPQYLHNNFSRLSAEGIKIELELPDGRQLSNTDTIGDEVSSSRKFKPAFLEAS